MEREKRFLLVADFLGTTARYANIEAVVMLRELLDRAVELCFQKLLKKEDLYVYIGSDSIWVACPSLQPLLLSTAQLFWHFLSMQTFERDKPLDLELLRGAISYGEIAEVTLIKNNQRLTAIPMLDNSLPRAISLERICPGSRIFLDSNIPVTSISPHERALLHWESITGRCASSEPVTEFLWPCMADEPSRSLCQIAERCRGEWLARLRDKKWNQKEYDEGPMLQLDETLKLVIRSLARFDDELEVRDYFMSVLPKGTDEVIDVRFEWGLWFQALKGLCEWSMRSRTISVQVSECLVVVLKILLDLGHWKHFITELKKSDYVGFKKSMGAILPNTSTLPGWL